MSIKIPNKGDHQGILQSFIWHGRDRGLAAGWQGSQKPPLEHIDIDQFPKDFYPR